MKRSLKRMWLPAAGAAAVLLPAFAHADTPAFLDWLEGFRAEAAAAGVREEVLAVAFEGVRPNERVLELNENQPEFVQNVWDYLDRAISTARLEGGKTRRLQHAELFDEIEGRYGVDAETIIAIWALESAFGANMGDHDAIAALATLAWKGRRTGYGREQLLGALRIVQNGYAQRRELRGSWAGAMGQTQFIPTTYLAYAIDHDGDGRRDIWSNLGDVFASTANYLSVSGYRRNAPWGVEVRLPVDFDYTQADPEVKRAVVEWSAGGVDGMTGPLLHTLDPNGRGRILLPAGARGPAFLVFENFEAILKYNRSTSYALAIVKLADGVAGRNPAILAAWPREDKPLTLAERKALQQALKDRGFDPGPVDGVIGAGTRRALRAWQSASGLPADGYPSSAILKALIS